MESISEIKKLIEETKKLNCRYVVFNLPNTNLVMRIKKELGYTPIVRIENWYINVELDLNENN